MESRQDEALAVICLFTTLAGLFVGARGFSRYLGQNFGWDDYLIGVSMILLLTETICVYVYILLSHTGFHVYDIPKQTIEEQVLAMKWSYYGVQMLYHPMMGVIRASIIMFLFRLKDHRRHIKWALHIVFWINIGYTVSTTIVSIAQCTPVRYAYMRPAMDTELDANGNIIKTGKCIESRTFILASCALSIFMDLIIIPIPTVMVWDLQMRTKTKIFVVIIMSMGWIATAVSAGRFVVYYYRYAPGNKDRTWDIGVIISIVEPAVGIIAACAPALKCLFRLLMPRYFTTEGGSAYPTHTSLHKSTHNGSSRQRKFGFNLGGNDGQSNRIDVGKEEQLYGMRPLGSIDSSERISGIPEALPHRTRSVKTGISESRSDGVEAEPKHILSNKNYS